MQAQEPKAFLKNYSKLKSRAMSSKRYLHDNPDFSDLMRVVAGDRKIDPYLVEKDYLLMHALYGLQQAGYAFQLKGGTSLSKGYGIIRRFSVKFRGRHSYRTVLHSFRAKLIHIVKF